MTITHPNGLLFDMDQLPDPFGAIQFIKEQGIGSGDNSSPPSSSLTWNPALNNCRRF